METEQAGENPSWDTHLPAAAAKLRALLRDVDSCSVPLWEGRALRFAIFRYTEIFLPMLAAYLQSLRVIRLTGNALSRSNALVFTAKSKLKMIYERAKQDGIYKELISDKEEKKEHLAPFRPLGKNTSPHAVCPIPPLDVAFCWALHRLSPLDYEKDCIAMFGCKIPAGGTAHVSESANGLEYVNVHNANDAASVTARLQWTVFARAVRTNEQRRFLRRRKCVKKTKTFLPTYLWPRFREGDRISSFKFKLVHHWNWVAPIEYNIQSASRRQKQFLYNISSSYYEEESSMIRGTDRYKKFLTLMRKNKGLFLVPMYDIDLVWHAHILYSSIAYSQDCHNFVGRFINHTEDDDRQEGSELQNGFLCTVKLWQDAYQEEYEDKHTNYKGKLSDRHERVFSNDKSNIVTGNSAWRKEFVKDLVCEDCSKKNALNMHKECRQEFKKGVRESRSGQVMGGACGGLYSKGFYGSSAYMVGVGGACGGFAGDSGGGCGCGQGGGACGAGACGAGAGGCGGGGGVCGGGGCGGGGGGCGGGCGGC